MGGANQRDGLVTVLAYVAGEEAFDDNNSNGQWDVGENFIDQGEPFVDGNDNNQWDPGEFYADVAPSNGKYDAPNGVWDKQTTVWTTTYVLYSGFQTQIEVAPASISVPVGGQTTVIASFADGRLNPPPAGAATTFSFLKTGVRGNANAVFVNILDGYPFDLTRALYSSADSSVPCNATLPSCQWLTKFTFGASPFSKGITATLTGAAAAAGGPENETLTFSAAVHGSKVDHVVPATWQ